MEGMVLVADSRRARLFDAEGQPFRLTEIVDFAQPRAVLEGDSPRGHIFAGESGTRHGLEPTSLPKDKQKRNFAVDLANYLEDELSHGNFSSLTVVAPPEFLGELRTAFSQRLNAVIGASIAKDLMTCTSDELAEYLRGQHISP